MALAAALTLAQAQAFAAATDRSGHWAEQMISKWQDKGLISCYEDGSSRTGNHVTRAEFVIMRNKALGFTEKGNVSFSDISAEAWYYDHVAVAVGAGCCSGYEDSVFQPNGTITRAEAALMIMKARGVVVTKDDTVMERQIIEGNLVIEESVGDDSIYFNNVVVKGKACVEKENERLRLKSDTEISHIEVKGACNLTAGDFEGIVCAITVTDVFAAGNIYQWNESDGEAVMENAYLTEENKPEDVMESAKNAAVAAEEKDVDLDEITVVVLPVESVSK